MPSEATPTWNKVAIVGVGLIGGSIGFALRKHGLAREVIGIGRRATSLSEAKRLGAVTDTSTKVASGVVDAQIVIIASPVDCIPALAAEVAAAAPKALITDVGSTKAGVVNQIGELNANIRFIGSHPIAGSERRGAQHGSADLFVDRTVIVTPTAKAAANDTRTIKKFWQALGGKVVQMTPEEHDQVVAAISHVPHLLASAIAASTPAGYVKFSAGGWQDTTRVAAADPAMWRQILLANREQVASALERFDQSLAAIRRALEQSNAAELERLLADAKHIRDAVAP